MPGESQKEPSTGQADPSVFTTEALQREVEKLNATIDDKVDGLRGTISERFRGMDEATKVLHETVTRTPTDIQRAVSHLDELMQERLESVRRLDIVRETHRQELKADAEKALSTAREADQKAVAAALAAAEKARDQQTIASQLATNKAETSFIDSLAKLTDTFTLAITGVDRSVGEIKDRLTTIETRQFSATENRTSNRLNQGQAVAIAVALLIFVSVVVGLIGLVVTAP